MIILSFLKNAMKNKKGWDRIWWNCLKPPKTKEMVQIKFSPNFWCLLTREGSLILKINILGCQVVFLLSCLCFGAVLTYRYITLSPRKNSFSHKCSVLNMSLWFKTYQLMSISFSMCFSNPYQVRAFEILLCKWWELMYMIICRWFTQQVIHKLCSWITRISLEKETQHFSWARGKSSTISLSVHRLKTGW